MMPSGALGLISKVSSKFFHEVIPVALASVIGTMLVNHYSRQAASPSVIVQEPPPPAARDAMFQTLHDEHELIVDYLRRDADAQHAAGAARDRAPLAAPAVEDRPNKVRLGFSREGLAAPAPKAGAEKTVTARDPEPLSRSIVTAIASPAGFNRRASQPETPASSTRFVTGSSTFPWRRRGRWPRGSSRIPPTPPLPVPVSSLQLTHEN